MTTVKRKTNSNKIDFLVILASFKLWGHRGSGETIPPRNSRRDSWSRLCWSLRLAFGIIKLLEEIEGDFYPGSSLSKNDLPIVNFGQPKAFYRIS